MAVIQRFPVLRHLRADPTLHVLSWRNGHLRKSGRGLSFWFLPLSTSIAEVPCDDRDVTFVFHGRSADFQDVSAQGVITYRVLEPELLAERLDFSIDLRIGHYQKKPLQQLAQLLSQLAQQITVDGFAARPVRDLLREGVEPLRWRILEGLNDEGGLEQWGLEIVSVRVSLVAPSAELEKALQSPTHENIQQQADEAMFQRRALAVEKERAIQENELQNQIELARREEQLIAQQGENERRRSKESVDARRIQFAGRAERLRLQAETEAEGLRVVGTAKAESEQAHMDVFKDLPTPTLLALAAQELAGKLHTIEHLNLSPDAFGPMLTSLMQAGTRRLGDGGEAA